jgi:hypothetical protein
MPGGYLACLPSSGPLAWEQQPFERRFLSAKIIQVETTSHMDRLPEEKDRLSKAILHCLLCLLASSMVYAHSEGSGQVVLSNAFSDIHSSQLPANAHSCAECNLSPAFGGSSRKTVMRAGSIVAGKYLGIEDGGILHTINYDTGAASATMHGPRVTINLLGDGYILKKSLVIKQIGAKYMVKSSIFPQET